MVKQQCALSAHFALFSGDMKFARGPVNTHKPLVNQALSGLTEECNLKQLETNSLIVKETTIISCHDIGKLFL